MQGRMTLENKMMRERSEETTFQQSELHCRAKKLCQSEGHIRDPKIRGGEGQASVVQKVDNAIHRINPVDSVVCFVSTYPLDSDLSGG